MVWYQILLSVFSGIGCLLLSLIIAIKFPHKFRLYAINLEKPIYRWSNTVFLINDKNVHLASTITFIFDLYVKNISEFSKYISNIRIRGIAGKEKYDFVICDCDNLSTKTPTSVPLKIEARSVSAKESFCIKAIMTITNDRIEQLKQCERFVFVYLDEKCKEKCIRFKNMYDVSKIIEYKSTND